MSDKNFIFDIIKQVLTYNDADMLLIFDDSGDPWFKLVDILTFLDYRSTKNQLNILKITDKNKMKYSDIVTKEYNDKNITKIKHNTYFVNESGLYELLNNSNKPIAGKFRFDVFNIIMPTIRKTGKYIISGDERNKLNKINNELSEKLDNYKNELEYYYDKYKFIPSVGGYIYINEVILIKNGQKMVGYKPGICKDMKQRKFAYKTGNFFYKLASYIPINLDRIKIESCYMNYFREHKYKPKSNNELLCFLSLTELKKGILKCINFISESICECVYCKDKYKIAHLDQHKCKKVLVTSKFTDINIDKMIKKNKIHNDKIINIDITKYAKNKSKSKSKKKDNANIRSKNT